MIVFWVLNMFSALFLKIIWHNDLISVHVYTHVQLLSQHPVPSVHVLVVESAHHMGQSSCASVLDKTVQRVSFQFLLHACLNLR